MIKMSTTGTYTGIQTMPIFYNIRFSETGVSIICPTILKSFKII